MQFFFLCLVAAAVVLSLPGVCVFVCKFANDTMRKIFNK